MVNRIFATRSQDDAPPSASETAPARRLWLWRDPLFGFVLAASLFAVAPFLLPGYFWSANDARHHVYFLFEYDRVVQDGIWWPRWSPDFAFGYGYPFFNIYGPLSHFLAELLVHFAGVGYTAAIESIFVFSILGSATSMYLFARDWASRHAAVVAALVYVYFPYHLLNLYVRGNLAESMAFVWLPLVLWTARQATLRSSFAWLCGLAVSYAALMMTSNLVIVLFTPLLAVYLGLLVVVYADARPTWFAQLWQWIRAGVAPAVGVLCGLGLSAVFWLPALLERQYVRVDQWFDGRYDFRGHFVFLYQMYSPQWDFGTSQIGPDDPIGFQIGAAPLILAFVGVLVLWRQIGRLRWEIAFFGAAAVGVALLTTTWSAPVWDLPFVGAILQSAQFPWRWYSIVTVCLSILAGLIMYPTTVEQTGTLSLPILVVVAAVLLSSYPLLRVEISEPAEGPIGLPALMRFQQSSDEMTGSTAWVKEIPTWSPMADEYISKERAGEPVTPVASMVDYTTLNYNRETGFVVNSERRTTVMEEVWYWSPLEGRRIVFNQFYYPGWTAYLLDGPGGKPVEELPIAPEAEGTLGRMTVPVPVGEGYVRLQFEDTPPRTIGRLISIATAGLLLIWGGVDYVWRRRRGQ